MDITHKLSDSVRVLGLAGRFDAHETQAVSAWFKEQTDAGNVHLVVNLSGVNFVDSTALSALVQGLKHCREKGGNLHLCTLQQPVRVIFELTRLDKAFSIFVTEDEAVKFH